MAELDQMLNTARPIMGRDGVARGSGSITPLLPAVKVLEADLMQSIWARSIWDLLQDVEEYIYFVCAQKDTQARHENLKQFGAEMQLHVASAKAQAELDAQGIATYFARDPYMKLASQMLQHDTVRARRLVPHLERCFARRPLDLEETTAAGGSGGDGGVGVQQPARGWLQFGERWQQLLAVADKADDQAEEVARMAVYGFLLLVAQQQGRFVADVDPLECAGVYFCYHFAEHVLGAFPDTRRLFTAMRVGFIPHVGWYNNLADSMPRRGSSRFGFRNLVNITFRAFFQPLAVDAWAKWARALAGGVEEIVGSAVEMVRAAELYYVLQRTGGEKDPYLERQLEFGLVVEQICAFAATQAYTTSVGVVDRSRDDYDDVDHADQPPLPLLALDLVDSLFNVANLLCSAPWRENTGGGGSAGTIPDVDFGLLPPMLDLELDSPEQALVLLLWAWRKLSETEGVFVCQPAVLMNAPVAAAADAACLESPQRVELLASVHWETLPRRGDVGYKWGWIKERIPLITATSNLGSHVKMILDALLKKRLMLMWIQCKGVIGLRRMLLALSQARREMLDAGRDFCLRCSTVLSWGDDESGGDEDGDATGERDGDGDHGGSDGGPSRCHNHPPHPHGRKSKAAKGRCGLTAAQQAAQDVMMQLDTRLRVHIGKLKLEPAQGRLDDRRQHHPSLNIYQEAYRLTEQFLGMVMAGVPEGVPAIRDGILLEFMMLECPPEQPWEAIRPAVPEHVRHQQEKQRNLQRKSELLREGA
ncbi:hypothetical protein Vretimale_18895 [Volvox reticuliferus]|nr:hypothetical protein Vretifemale_17287 [Volvox reticuliferus]GIM16306.1 hypothetical protein Vretimale_18895 [Volvox reticuliferus]